VSSWLISIKIFNLAILNSRAITSTLSKMHFPA
jgi:hypothetical protein